MIQANDLAVTCALDAANVEFIDETVVRGCWRLRKARQQNADNYDNPSAASAVTPGPSMAWPRGRRGWQYLRVPVGGIKSSWGNWL